MQDVKQFSVFLIKRHELKLLSRGGVNFHRINLRLLNDGQIVIISAALSCLVRLAIQVLIKTVPFNSSNMTMFLVPERSKGLKLLLSVLTEKKANGCTKKSNFSCNMFSPLE